MIRAENKGSLVIARKSIAAGKMLTFFQTKGLQRYGGWRWADPSTEAYIEVKGKNTIQNPRISWGELSAR